MQSRRPMRASRAALLAAATGVSFALYAQTLGLSPGMYEFTSTHDVQLPPDLAARLPPQALATMQKPHVSQHCISQADVDHVSQQIAQGQSNQPESCQITEHSVSGSQVKFTSQCGARVSHFEGSFASDSFQGTMVSSGNRGQVTIKMSARRLGACSK